MKYSFPYRGISIIISLLLVASPAYAYLDPGTGSAILQGIIAAFAALAVTLKLYWYRIMRFLGIRKNTPVKPENKAEIQSDSQNNIQEQNKN